MATSPQSNQRANAPATRAGGAPADRLRRFAFGDDVFISYSRRRGAEYALALANELTRQKLSCFLDQWGTPPGRKLPDVLKQALKRSTMLVLVGTEWAAASENVRKEVEEFLKTGRTVIPITFVEDDVYAKVQEGTLEGEFKGTLERADWYPLIQGVALTVESAEALRKNRPSPSVVSRIVNAKGFRSRSRRLRTTFWATLASILLLLGAGGVAAKVLSDRVAEANRLRGEAEASARQADQNRAVAEERTKKANEDLQTAQATLKDAEGKLALASTQLTAANEKRDEAQAKAAQAARDQQLAEEKTAQAEAQQAAAEQQQRRATSERLATESGKEVEASPQRGLLLATDAVKTYERAGDPPVALAQQALWDALSNNGGRVLGRGKAHSAGVSRVAVSPDRRLMATTSDKETLLWNLSADGTPTEPTLLAPASEGEPVTNDLSLAFSPDGRWLVEGMRDGKARLWDVRAPGAGARKPLALELPGDEIDSAGFTPDGRWAVTKGERSVLLWDLKAADPSAAPVALGSSARDPLEALTKEMAAIFEEVGKSEGKVSEKRAAELQQRAAEIQAELERLARTLPYLVSTPDFRWVVVGTADSDPALYDLTAGGPDFKPITLGGFGGKGLVLSRISVSPDRRRLAALVEAVQVGGHEGTAEIENGARPADGAEATDTARVGDEQPVSNQFYVWDLNAGPAAGPKVFKGHESFVRALEFSPDGRWLVSASHDQTARLWDFQQSDPSAKPLVLGSHPGWVTHVAFSPDGRWLATGGANLDKRGSNNPGGNSVKLWELKATPRPKLMTPYRGPVEENLSLPVAGRSLGGLSFSPDSQWLVARSSGDTDRRPNKGQVVNLWHMHAPLGPDYRGPVKSLVDERIELRGHEGLVTAAVFSPDSRWLVTGGGADDKSLRLWRLANRELTAGLRTLVSGEGDVSTFQLSNDNRWMVVVTDRAAALLWDLSAADAATKYAVVGWGDKFFSEPLVALSPDSRWLVTANSNKEKTKWDLRLYDLSAGGAGARPVLLEGHTAPVGYLAFTPDGRRLFTGGADKKVLAWDLSAGAVAGGGAPPHAVVKVHEGEVNDLAVSADGRWLATADAASGKAFLWRLDTFREGAAPVELKGHAGPVTTVRFSPDGRRLATGSKDKTARLWELSAADPSAHPLVLSGHEAPVESVTFSPDGRWLAASNHNFRAQTLHNRQNNTGGQAAEHVGRLWDLRSPDPARKPLAWHVRSPSLRTFNFSPDGRWLLTSKNEMGDPLQANEDSRTAMLWDLKGGDGPKVAALLRLGGWWYNASFSPDSHWLIAGVRLWDMTADDPSASTFTLPEPGPLVGSTAFTGDSRLAVVGAVDKVALYPLRTEALLEMAERAAARNLTPDEWRRVFPTQKYRKVFERLP